MLINILLLVAGFFILVYGADTLVRGSIHIANHFNISHWVIGFTIVAFGGSLPEWVVTILAIQAGSPSLAFSNLLGSVTANIFLVLGVSAVLSPLVVSQKTRSVYIPFSLAVVFIIIFSSVVLQVDGPDTIGRWTGAILSIFFMGVFIFMIKDSKSTDNNEEDESTEKKAALPKATIMVVGGLAGLLIGAKWITDSAISLASILGIQESFIGFTIVAIGTSLPELAASIAAVKRKNAEIAVANVVGSNVFDLSIVLASASLLHPLKISSFDLSDLMICLIANVMLFLVPLLSRKKQIEQFHGLLFLSCYIGYIIFIAVLQV